MTKIEELRDRLDELIESSAAKVLTKDQFLAFPGFDEIVLALIAAAREEGAEKAMALIPGLYDGKDWAFWRSIMDLTECPHYAEPETCLDRCGGSICNPLDAGHCRLSAEMEHLAILRMKRASTPPRTKGEPMTSLESIVLPLAESKTLVEKGIVLETALVWVEYSTAHHSVWHVRERSRECAPTLVGSIPAPALSELLDVIRNYVARPTDKTLVLLERSGFGIWAGVRTILYSDRTNGGDSGIQYRADNAPTDLLAAYNLLMEVSK